MRIEGQLKNEDLCFGLEEIVINGCYKKIERFHLTGFCNLKVLILHKVNMNGVKCLCIENCNELTDLKLGGIHDDYNDNENEDDSLDRVFQIWNCKNLMRINIGDYWYMFKNNSIILQGNTIVHRMIVYRSSQSSNIHYR